MAENDDKTTDNGALDPADIGDGNPEPKDDTLPPEGEGKTGDDKQDDTDDKSDGPPDDKSGEGEGEGDDKSDDLDHETWGDTGDEVGNSVLKVLQDSGISVEDARGLLEEAVIGSDASKIDKEALIEKVGKANANLIVAGIENVIARREAHVQGVITEIHKVAGDKDTWNKVAGWVQKNVSEADRDKYATMIDQGGPQARFAAQELIGLYNADPKNTSVGEKETIEGDGVAPDSGEALTKTQYFEKLEAAYNRNATQAEIRQIQLARQRGRKRGI